MILGLAISFARKLNTYASSDSKMQRWGAERKRIDTFREEVLGEKPLSQYDLLKKFAKLPKENEFDRRRRIGLLDG